MPFDFTMTGIDGLFVIEPSVFTDSRGFLLESYKASEFRSHGLPDDFVQDNHSRSTIGVLRGLHFQRPPHAQGKLVRVIAGAIWDVAVDLRKDSATFKSWYAIELTAENRKELYISAGFAHGFLTLSNAAEILYKCTAEYDKDSDSGVRWNDPELAIQWPMTIVTLSEKDAALPFLRELR